MKQRIEIKAKEPFYNRTFCDYNAFITLVTNEKETIGVLSHTRKETLLELIKYIEAIPEMVKALESVENNEKVNNILNYLNS
jgi:ApbE superfamily uncharacterized protein (UPF0280 family)